MSFDEMGTETCSELELLRYYSVLVAACQGISNRSSNRPSNCVSNRLSTRPARRLPPRTKVAARADSQGSADRRLFSLSLHDP